MKKRKYAEGGDMNEDSSYDEQFFSSEELTKQAKKPTYAASTKLDERDKREMAIQERVREKAKAEPKTRGEAFKKARAEGKKVFEYPKGSGNMFTTETAEEKKAREAAKKKEPAKKETSPKKEPPSMKAGPSRLRSGAKAVAEKNPGDFDKMMEERKKARKRTPTPTLSVSDVIGAKKGGMMKKYNRGGYANCGASVKPNGGSRNK